jgi:xylulose-5-phosphate/fructose-6-phosphate phosphoketolase
VGGDTAADSLTTGSGKTRAPQPYELGEVPGPLGAGELRRLDAWWRAANYLRDFRGDTVHRAPR